jgi:UDPglucose 6-dehydrogenase
MKIVVVGLGYVGLSNAVLLAQHNEVIGVDISQEKVDVLKNKKSPIIDAEISKYLAEKDLNLSATTDLKSSIIGADYVIVSTPTNYDEKTNFFDTTMVSQVISDIIEENPKSCIVVKSTIPVGYVDELRERFVTDKIIFSPEFLREGKALSDNLYPSRIIIGDKSQQARVFANLLVEGAVKENIDLLFTGSREAEAIKLFSNTYLAMRVAFFNELDSYALASKMNSREIIEGVSYDPRIGDGYNNPSFGYGGYCLPKDTKQLLANFGQTPKTLMKAIVESNGTRKKYLVDTIIKGGSKLIGVYQLAMKQGSDNSRESAVIDLLYQLKKRNVDVLIYDENIKKDTAHGCSVESNLSVFKEKCDLIITNRMDESLDDVSFKVFTRDIYQRD